MILDGQWLFDGFSGKLGSFVQVDRHAVVDQTNIENMSKKDLRHLVAFLDLIKLFLN